MNHTFMVNWFDTVPRQFSGQRIVFSRKIFKHNYQHPWVNFCPYHMHKMTENESKTQRQGLRYKRMWRTQRCQFLWAYIRKWFFRYDNKITNDKKLLTLPRVKPKRRHCQSDNTTHSMGENTIYRVFEKRLLSIQNI